MDELKQSLQAIKNTLAGLTIQATEDNMGKLMACQQLLTTIIERMDADGNAAAE